MNNEFKLSFKDIVGEQKDFSVGDLVLVDSSYFSNKLEAKQRKAIVVSRSVEEAKFSKRRKFFLFSVFCGGKILNLSGGYLKKIPC